MEERLARHRNMVEAEVVGGRDSEGEGDAWHREEDSREGEEGEIDDEETEWRCGMMQQRAQEGKDEEMEVMEVEDGGRSEEDALGRRLSRSLGLRRTQTVKMMWSPDLSLPSFERRIG